MPTQEPHNELMESARYRAPEAMRWFDTGTPRRMRSTSTDLVPLDDKPIDVRREVATRIATAATKTREIVTDLARQRAEALEYALLDDRFEVRSATRLKAYRYQDIRRIVLRGDRATVEIGEQKVTIKPLAYLLMGRLRVPIGWNRNGLDVPYEVLLDELAARSGVEIERA